MVLDADSGEQRSAACLLLPIPEATHVELLQVRKELCTDADTNKT